MVYFRVNGKVIDMRKDTKMSFYFNNSFFGFENIKLSRSTSFAIPKTPNNNNVFNFDYMPQKYGDNMRINFPAVMYYSGGVIDGILFVSDVTDTDYNAVFVYGELLELKAIQEAGDIKGLYLDTDLVLDWSLSTPIITARPYFDELGLRRYNSLDVIYSTYKRWQWMPSFGLFNYTADALLDKFGIYLPSLPGNAAYDYYRQLGIKMNGTYARRNKSGRIIMMRERGRDVSPNPPFPPIIYEDGNYQFIGSWTDYFDLVQHTENNTTFQALQAKQDCVVQFTITAPEIEVFYVKRNGSIISTFQYYPGASENIFVSVEFRAGDIMYSENPAWAVNDVRRYYFSAWTGSFIAIVDTGEIVDIEFPGEYPFIENLPDITLLDILKIYAHLTGTAIDLVVTEYPEPLGPRKEIRFFDFNFTELPEKLDDIVISFDNISRTVGDYAQNNIVEFDSPEDISDSGRISKIYNINNANITDKKILYTIPLSEGRQALSMVNGTSPTSGIRDIQYDGVNDGGLAVYSYGNDSDTLVWWAGTDTVTDNVNLKRPIGIDNPYFNNIMQRSTTVKLRVKMYLFEFMKINNKSTFLFQNNKYICFESNWSNGIASLTLIQI